MPSDKIVPEKIYLHQLRYSYRDSPAKFCVVSRKYNFWNRSGQHILTRSSWVRITSCWRRPLLQTLYCLNCLKYSKIHYIKPAPTDIVPTKSLQPLWNAMMWCMRMHHIHITCTVYSWICDNMWYVWDTITASFLVWCWLNLLRCHTR